VGGVPEEDDTTHPPPWPNTSCEVGGIDLQPPALSGHLVLGPPTSPVQPRTHARCQGCRIDHPPLAAGLCASRTAEVSHAAMSAPGVEEPWAVGGHALFQPGKLAKMLSDWLL
jgi:hypothetical protein